MKVGLDRNLVKDILIQETFYNQVPEYYYLKEAGYKIVQEMSKEGGCSSCAERNIIEPTIAAFVSHTVNLYLDCGPQALEKFKKYLREFLEAGEDFEVYVMYKNHENEEPTEIVI